jgi:hypothetical protein
MRSYTVVLVTILVAIALAPWIISSCSPQPLVPDTLREEREEYQSRRAIIESERLQEDRDGDSNIRVIVEGPFDEENGNETEHGVENTENGDLPTGDETGGSGAEVPDPENVRQLTVSSSSVISTPVVGETDNVDASALSEMGTPTATVAPDEESSSAVVVSTSVAQTTPEPTSRVIVVQSTVLEATPEPSDGELQETDTSTPDSQETGTQEPEPVTHVITSSQPSGMVDVEDLITSQSLTDQVKQSESGSALSNLNITITGEGLEATGSVAVFAGIRRPLQAVGVLTVENESLVVQVESIRFDGMDVTDQYRGQLESHVNSSLYRLLPQRHVQSFELVNDEIHVRSLMRP